jgi:hypothetical protein
MAIKYTKWPWNIPNGREIYQHLSLHHPPKFTQIWNFGLKIYHLATLIFRERIFNWLGDVTKTSSGKIGKKCRQGE